MPPISASEAEARARDEARAKAAGWRRADLDWERLQEDAMAAWRAGDIGTAIANWRRARSIAFWRFRRRDPRFVTSLANAAMAARLRGREAQARALYATAIRRWRRVADQVEDIEPSRRARSSLFHLRMEARHRDTYVANQRTRMRAFAADAGQALEALCANRVPECRLYERWRGEKPPIFDDMRKFLSAALLIAAPLPEATAAPPTPA